MDVVVPAVVIPLDTITCIIPLAGMSVLDTTVLDDPAAPPGYLESSH